MTLTLKLMEILNLLNKFICRGKIEINTIILVKKSFQSESYLSIYGQIKIFKQDPSNSPLKSIGKILNFHVPFQQPSHHSRSLKFCSFSILTKRHGNLYVLSSSLKKRIFQTPINVYVEILSIPKV